MRHMTIYMVRFVLCVQLRKEQGEYNIKTKYSSGKEHKDY